MWEFNPGSDEAIKRGCVCPILDNEHGRGCGWVNADGTQAFWITQGCPLHSLTEIKDEQNRRN